VKLDAKDKRDIFWLRFERRLIPESEDMSNADGSDGPGSVVPAAPDGVAKHRPGPKAVQDEGAAVPEDGSRVKAGRGNLLRTKSRSTPPAG